MIINLRRFLRNQRKSRKNNKPQKGKYFFLLLRGRRESKQSQEILFGTSNKRGTFQEN